MIIVTGMHRSGTSFATSLLRELGMPLAGSDRLYQADEWNPRGYFEHVDVLVLNEKLLLGDFLYPECYRRNPAERKRLGARVRMFVLRSKMLWLRSLDVVERRAERRRVQIERMSDRASGCVVKDPRFSLTLGAWRRYGKVERILYCFRHPEEVAGSLRRRDRMPRLLGLRLWNLHVEGFLRLAEGLDVTFVNFANFFDPELRAAEVRRCVRFARLPQAPEGGAVIERILRRGDRHHWAQGSSRLPRRTREVYDELLSYHRVAADRAFARREGSR